MASNWATPVLGVASNMLAYAKVNRTLAANNFLSRLTDQLAAISYPTGLNYITRGNRDPYSGYSPNMADTYKLFRIKDSASGAFNFSDLIIKNSRVSYTFTSSSPGGVVNGFIGNNYNITDSISLGNIIGSSFENIGILFYGRSTHYLAGGGLIGVRSGANSATIGQIVGNQFKDLRVLVSGSNPSQGYAYLEGGGIIGLDAVADGGAGSGYAYLYNLESSLFTNINIKSDSSIFGGGLVGANNNSQARAANVSAGLEFVIANVFGDGGNGDLKVEAVSSLLGGGIIGLRGQNAAAARLQYLTGNVFAGLQVTAGQTLSGGGIVGLEVSGSIGSLVSNIGDASLNYASENLFLNLAIASPGQLWGGGVIGLNSGPGRAALGYLDNNIFKSLKVNAGELLGGGLVGANSGWSSYLASVTNNYFDEIDIQVTGNLSGGGLMGARSSGPSASAASLSLLTSNMFDAISVNVAGDIFGAGLIGAAVLDGSASSLASSLSLSQNFFGYNINRNISVRGHDIYGGGLIGFYSANGSAFAQSIDSNDFKQNAVSTINIQASGQLIGGGAIGATIGQNSKGIASIYSLTNNYLREIKVDVNSSLIGGGLVGLVALGDGDANIQIVKDN
ncbi:MAG: hypothetical protein LBT38_12400, partial [Deltaproteobacteria bacterium]|nr:hypothetical protein [Deltaproteobacteria bacterium]